MIIHLCIPTLLEHSSQLTLFEQKMAGLPINAVWVYILQHHKSSWNYAGDWGLDYKVDEFSTFKSCLRKVLDVDQDAFYDILLQKNIHCEIRSEAQVLRRKNPLPYPLGQKNIQH